MQVCLAWQSVLGVTLGFQRLDTNVSLQLGRTVSLLPEEHLGLRGFGSIALHSLL